MSDAGDAGRTAVYAAEAAAFGGTDLDDARPLGELIAAAATLTGGEWWRVAAGPSVVVAAARDGSASSSARSRERRGNVSRASPRASERGGTVEVRLAAAQRTTATLAHELAHALAGIPHGHDPTFRAAHVDVCAVLAGQRAGDALTAAYRELGVRPGRRTWPSPVRVTGDGFVVVP